MSFFLSTNSSEVLQNPTIKAVNEVASVPLEEQYFVPTPETKLSSKANQLGKDFVMTRGLFSTYRADAVRKDRPFELNDAIHEKHGEILMEQAKKFAKESGLTYRMTTLTEGERKLRVMQISPEGKHPLNQEAAILKEKYGTIVIYDPIDLLRTISGASYDSNYNRLRISEIILVNGSIEKDGVGAHELTHLNIAQYYKNNVPYRLHGQIFASKGALPGKNLAYSKSLSMEEVDAYLTSVIKAVENLINFENLAKNLPMEEQRILKGMFIADLDGALNNGYFVSSTINHLMTLTTTVAKAQELPMAFIPKNNHYQHANWALEMSGTSSEYVFEIPITYKKNMTQQEQIFLAAEAIQAVKLITHFRQNQIKVGLNKFKNIERIPQRELAVILKKYKKVLETTPSFESHKTVPTQKELAKSLE